MAPERAAQVVLVGGHESADGAELARFGTDLDGVLTASPGRAFHNSLVTALDEGRTVVVVPMTFGRNPTMVADAAKTLKWLNGTYPGRIALSAPFGQIDHLTSWLRTAANRAKVQETASALLIVAPKSNPFDEAELHRIAYLVATHGALTEVAVAIGDDEAAVAVGIQRLRKLGFERVVTVPAGFAERLPESDAAYAGPLMSDASVARVIRTRVNEALASLRNGHDGIDAGLDADHGHGYAHSHAFDESQGTGHGHTHGHGGHSHGHAGHSHGHGDHMHEHAGQPHEVEPARGAEVGAAHAHHSHSHH